jgi:hypothetical protein
MSEVVELRPTGNLLDMEENLRAVKGLAFAINLIASSDGDNIQRGAANALWQIARQIENHADALREQWEAAFARVLQAKGWAP